MDKNILIIAIANVLIKAMFVYGAVQCKDSASLHSRPPIGDFRRYRL